MLFLDIAFGSKVQNRTYPSKIFRRFFGLFWPLFDFKLWGLYTCRYCPQRFESKIGSKEPKNRLKLFTRIGSYARNPFESLRTAKPKVQVNKCSRDCCLRIFHELS